MKAVQIRRKLLLAWAWSDCLGFALVSAWSERFVFVFLFVVAVVPAAQTRRQPLPVLASVSLGSERSVVTMTMAMAAPQIETQALPAP